MPASVVVVHDDPAFLEASSAALQGAGHEVASFTDPMVALNAIEAARRVEVLVTRVIFPEGKPNGVSLALVGQTKRPGLKVLFVADRKFKRHTEGIGEFIPHPVELSSLVEAVTRLVQESRQGAV